MDIFHSYYSPIRAKLFGKLLRLGLNLSEEPRLPGKGTYFPLVVSRHTTANNRKVT